MFIIFKDSWNLNSRRINVNSISTYVPEDRPDDDYDKYRISLKFTSNLTGYHQGDRAELKFAKKKERDLVLKQLDEAVNLNSIVREEKTVTL